MKNGSGYDAFKTLGGLSIERSAYILVIGGLSIERSAYILVIGGLSIERSAYILVFGGLSIERSAYILVFGGLSIERSAYILVIALGPYATCCPRPTWCSAHMLLSAFSPHCARLTY